MDAFIRGPPSSSTRVGGQLALRVRWGCAALAAAQVSCAETPQGDAQAPPLTLDEFWVQFSAAKREAERVRPSPGDAVPRSWEYDGWYELRLRAIREGLAAGTIRFDPAAAGCFLRRLRTRSSESFFSLWRGCSPVMVGLRAEGAACHSEFECEGELMCQHENGDRNRCPGRCRHRTTAPGGACTSSASCMRVPGSYTRCETFGLQRFPGDEVRFVSNCVATAVEPPVTLEGGGCVQPYVQSAFMSSAPASTVWRPCGPGMACVVPDGPAPGATQGACRRQVALGERCSVDIPCVEGTHCIGAAGQSRCALDARIGRACTRVEECEGLECREGRCAEFVAGGPLAACEPHRAGGAPCATSNDCCSGSCDGPAGAPGVCSDRLCY